MEGKYTYKQHVEVRLDLRCKLFVAHFVFAKNVAREAVFCRFVRVGSVGLDDEFVVWAVRLR